MFDNLLIKIKTIIENNKHKLTIQLLEPLSTIVRLSCLYFDSEGTKIAIYNNRIIKQKPHLMQGTIRWSRGNKRHDLYNLYKPIVVAMKDYDPIKSESIKTIFNYAIKGLNKLKHTYQNTNGTIICHSIDLYKDTIQNKITKKNIKPQNTLSFDELTNRLYEQFTDLWEKDHINLIAELLQLANDTKDIMTQKALINSIDLLITVKEKKTLQLINEATKNIKS